MTKKHFKAAGFLLLAAILTIYAGTKPDIGFRLEKPLETPDGVWFQWAGASADQTHSLYRRLYKSEGATWERIAMGLSGVNGGTLVQGFTLDQTYEYELREDAP